MTHQTSPETFAETSPDTSAQMRSVELTRIGPARFKATNARGGETFFGTGGEDPDFTPVELLLAAIAGCSALDVEAITHKRVSSTTYDVHAEGRKVRDEHGRVQGAMEMSRDRLCTVARTVQLGAAIDYEQVS